MLVAALVTDTAQRRDLRKLLPARVEVLWPVEPSELRRLALANPPAVIVIAPWDASGRPTAPVVRELRADLPSTPIVVFCRFAPVAVRELLALARAGADDVLLSGVDQRWGDVWRTLAPLHRTVMSRALPELGPLVPTLARPVLAYCVEHAADAPSVESLAHELGLSRRAIGYRMRSARLPTARSLLSWCRLLLAADLLADHRSVESVALELGYGSGSALSATFRRYLGMLPSELQRRGGTEYVLDALKKQIGEPRRSGAERR